MTPAEKQHNSIQLMYAVERGDTAEVARLLPLSDLSFLSNSPLCEAARGGHVECVKLLIPISPSLVVNEHRSPITIAAEQGHTECVQLLIPTSEESWRHHALCMAVAWGQVDCVKLLIGACNPKEGKSLPLQLAVEYNKHECLELLYDVSDPLQAREALQFRCRGQTEKWRALEEFEAKRQRAVLSTALGEVGDGATIRKHKM